MDAKPLTGQQQRVYDFLVEFFREHGFAPSLREIGQALGLANVNAVRGHVSALQKKGHITRQADKARSISIVRKPSHRSRLRRRLHHMLRTNDGVRHRIVYGMAWTTWKRRHHFTGQRMKWIHDAIDQEVVNRGWTLVEKRIGPDHLVLVVEVWPNHAPDQTVQRMRSAGVSMWRRHPGKFEGSRLWGDEVIVTTDLKVLDDLVAELLNETEQKEDSQQPSG